MNSTQVHSVRSAVHPIAWLGIWTLAWREIIRFIRQRSRFVGALAQPVLFWLLFGAGLQGSFQAPDWAPAGTSYQEYFFPGITVLILMFTAIFASISVIEDRHEGFLQGVLVSPVSHRDLVLGKLTGATLLAVGQAVFFLGIGWVYSAFGSASGVQADMGLLNGISLLLFLCLIAFGLSALGFTIAWRLDSVQGFHAIMSVVLMPMWLVSGAMFPGEDSVVLLWIMRLNPLSYGVAGVRHLLAGNVAAVDVTGVSGGQVQDLPAMTTCVIVTAVFGAVCLLTAVRQVRRVQ